MAILYAITLYKRSVGGSVAIGDSVGFCRSSVEVLYLVGVLWGFCQVCEAVK